VEVLKQEGTSTFAFPKKSVTRFDFPARRSMPPVKVFWYDAMSGAAYRPPGLAEGEPLIGGEGSFGARGQAFTGGGPQRGGTPPAGATPRGAATPPAGAAERGAGRGGRGGRGGGGGGGGQSNGAVFVGDKGVLTTDTYGANCRLLPAARQNDTRLPAQLLTRSPGHYRDWIRACKGGDPACSNFGVAGPFTEWILLGVIALRVEGQLEWDANKMKFANNSEANRYVKPEVRKGWSLT
jgi:hypothetical protein